MADVEQPDSRGIATRGQPDEGATGPRGDAERLVQMAFDQTMSANESGTPTTRVNALERLQDAVDEARNAGVGWERIGAILGIARGNAYVRHRKRPKT